jgi:hypothetical protein
MKNVVLWDVAPGGSSKIRRFGGIDRFYPQSRKFIEQRKALAVCKHATQDPQGATSQKTTFLLHDVLSVV